MESYSSREFVLYFLVSLFSCFDHFIGVFYCLVGRSMLSCYHGVHGQPRRAFAFFVAVVDFFLNNNNLQFLTSKIERVLGKKKKKTDRARPFQWSLLFTNRLKSEKSLT